MHSVMFAAQKFARSAHARLHFVGDKQDIAFFAVVVNLRYKLLILRNNAALALDKFQHYGADAFLLFYLLYILAAVDKAFVEGEEIVVHRLLRGGGKRSHGSAVEGLVKGDNLIPACAVLVKGVLARRLDSRFVRFRARIAEEYLFISRPFTKRLGKFRAGGSVIEVGSVLERFQLLFNRLYPAAVAVSQAVHAYAAAQVDILFALFVLALRAASAHDMQIESAVSA